jgi:Putative DNA-binding domain
LDFQRPTGDGRWTGLHGDDLNILSRAISGFSNSEGGVIVWGVDATVADAKKPIDNVSRFVRWLDNSVSGLSIPAHPKIQNHAIRIGSGDGFAVTLIPRSNLTPHRASSDDQYYMRRNSNFVPIPHRVLSLMFN